MQGYRIDPSAMTVEWYGIASEDSGSIVVATTVVGAGTLAVIIGWLYG